jgi:cytochrome c peroxidase
LATAISIDNKTNLRNTPTLWNAALQTRQFFDSRTTTLEDQMSAVVHNSAEMKGSLEESVPLLQQHPVYKKLFQQAYPEHKEPIIQYNIGNAIASYIRSLTALNSRFDQYIRGDKTKMNAVEKNGFNLFMGKAKCGTCHYMPLFNGLVPTEFTETESEVLGVPKTNDKKKPFLDSDEGKFGFTTATVHRFAFKTATLRNIALTAPYMHNGVFNTLEEVMDFYNNGGGSGLHIAPETQTLPPGKLNLASKEIKDIIAFMKTLTDTTAKK